MPSYRVQASKTIYLTTIIQADDLEHAEHIAQHELIVDDFTESLSVAFNLDGVTEFRKESA
jgi:hypothetical protein